MDPRMRGMRLAFAMPFTTDFRALSGQVKLQQTVQAEILASRLRDLSMEAFKDWRVAHDAFCRGEAGAAETIRLQERRNAASEAALMAEILAKKLLCEFRFGLDRIGTDIAAGAGKGEGGSQG